MKIDRLQELIGFVLLGALLIGRTIAVLATTTVATSMAARLGPVPMAGHEICFQVWLAVSLLTDALALAGQVGTTISSLPFVLHIYRIYIIVNYLVFFFFHRLYLLLVFPKRTMVKLGKLFAESCR